VVIEASRVVCAYARLAVLSGKLSRREREELSDLPAVVTRTILLVSLLFQADSGYRRAGKGLRLRLDAAGVPVQEDEYGFGPLWHEDPPLEAAVAEYDRRRLRYWDVPAGMPVLRRQELLDGDAVLWPHVGGFEPEIRVRYPRLGEEYVTRNYMLSLSNIAERLDHLEVLGDDFTARYGLSVPALRRICQALGVAVVDFLAFGLLEFGEVTGGRLVGVSDLDVPAAAPGLLQEVFTEGVVRAPVADWRATLCRAGAEPDEASAFLTAFTARPDDPRQALLPRLFRVIEKDRLALDLIATTEFLDLCYREVVASRDVGRGKDFERLARPYLEQRLDLKPPWPVPPNFKFRRSGQTAGENDFCFFWRDAVVHMDMKAKGRSDEIFQGVHEKTRNRVSQLGDRLFKQVEPRGELLSEHLHGRYVVVDLLCTSDVEYLPPDPRLRYGSVPRVLTPAEIADVLLDDERWAEMLNGATLAIRDRG
jgi:hypothetical protein